MALLNSSCHTIENNLRVYRFYKAIILISIFLSSCSLEKDNKLVKEKYKQSKKTLVIGCFPVFFKKYRNIIIHNHKENGEETMNTQGGYSFYNKYISCEPTHKKNIFDIQTSNPKDKKTYMHSNHYDNIIFEGVPNVDAHYLAHKNVYNMLKKGGKLKILRAGHLPQFFYKDENSVIGPFLWSDKLQYITLHSSYKIEDKSKDISQLTNQSKCSSISKLCRDYVLQPIYNSFTYLFPFVSFDYFVEEYIIKKGKLDDYHGYLLLVKYYLEWIKGYNVDAYKLSKDITLEKHIENSEKKIKKYFIDLGFSAVSFKYPSIKDKSEYSYEIICIK